MENKKIRKSNVFIEGRYRFNVNEQKILLLVISHIRANEKEFVPYRVKWSDIKQATNDKLNTTKKIDEACEVLKNKTIKITNGREEDNFGFLSGWKTYPGRYVEFRIDPGMRSLLLDLLEKGNFTLYDLECVLSLNSSYSIRIYELLKSVYWQNRPVTVSLDRLKWILDIDSKNSTYQDFGNFRRLVLEKAKADLKKYTDLSFTYETEKELRKVVSVIFTVEKNQKIQKTVSAVLAKQEKEKLKDGDKILIAGKEYVFESGFIMMDDGILPEARIQNLLLTGSAKRV